MGWLLRNQSSIKDTKIDNEIKYKLKIELYLYIKEVMLLLTSCLLPVVHSSAVTQVGKFHVNVSLCQFHILLSVTQSWRSGPEKIPFNN